MPELGCLIARKQSSRMSALDRVVEAPDAPAIGRETGEGFLTSKPKASRYLWFVKCGRIRLAASRGTARNPA